MIHVSANLCLLKRVERQLRVSFEVGKEIVYYLNYIHACKAHVARYFADTWPGGANLAS